MAVAFDPLAGVSIVMQSSAHRAGYASGVVGHNFLHVDRWSVLRNAWHSYARHLDRGGRGPELSRALEEPAGSPARTICPKLDFSVLVFARFCNALRRPAIYL